MVQLGKTAKEKHGIVLFLNKAEILSRSDFHYKASILHILYKENKMGMMVI